MLSYLDSHIIDVVSQVELKIRIDEVTSVTVPCSWCLTLDIVSYSDPGTDQVTRDKMASS